MEGLIFGILRYYAKLCWVSCVSIPQCILWFNFFFSIIIIISLP